MLHGVVVLLQKNVQLSPAKPFSNSRSLFLIFANWRLRGVLEPRKHNSAPLSIANDTLVFIHDIVAAQGSPFLVDISSANRQ